MRAALATAVDSVAAQVPQAVRESLTSVLHERFDAPPAMRDLPAVSDLGAALREAFDAQIAPLRDRSLTGIGQSYLDGIGVDGDWLARELLESFIGALRRATAAAGVGELVSRIEAEKLLIEVRSLQPVATAAPALALDSLPRDVSDFIDREEALARIAASRRSVGGTDAPAVYAIDGMPGVGKTALAVHAAHRLAPHFPDARLFLDLHAHSHGRSPVDPTAALEALLRALGLAADQVPASLDGRAGLWRSQLAGKRALVVLDNAAAGEQVHPLLPASRGCVVIVTSRRRLAGLEGSRTVSLDVLDTDEAMRLFARTVGADRAAADPDTVRKIVARCALLPLAVRLIAARLHHHPAWSPRDMFAELATAQNRLEEIRAEGNDIMAVFELSYAGLDSAQKRMFRRLGLHPGQDFSLYAAAALNGTDLTRARRGLEELYDHHLVEEPRYGRYLLHDLLHDYARQRVEEEETPAERAEAVDRLLDYYTFVSSRADKLINLLGHRDDEVEWQPASVPQLASHTDAIAWMEAERLNLLACVQLAIERDRRPRAAVLARLTVYFLRLKGYWGDALSLCQNTASLCADIGDRASAADMQFYCGDIFRLTGRHPEALRQYENALAAYQDLSDRHCEARTLHSIGDIERAAVRYASALERYEAAMAVYRELVNPIAEARALHSIADTHRLAGRHDEARSHYQRIIATYRDLDDRVGEARVVHSIGDLDRLSGRYDEALRACRRALLAYQELGDGLGVADALLSIGETNQAMGRYPDALRHYEDAQERYRSLGDRRGEAMTLQALGSLHRSAGRLDDARAAYETAAAISRALDDPYLEASAHCGVGLALVLSGDTAQAVPRLRQALTLLESLDTPEADRIRARIAEIGGIDESQ
jgi:tetratricopeptide (TPR) repeat protein